ncbi:MAG: PKD domain-containing protein [Natrialbaceae archaeon]|nr:PKD domain-containing protein [Natrialbaceae archaeon]
MTVVLLLGAAAVPTAAQNQPDDPEVPGAYYGSVTIDGEPAPVGTVIDGVVNGSVEGSITVQSSGTYGGPTVEDPKLTVQGYEGETVSFYVNGPNTQRTQADQTVSLVAFDDRELDLSASSGGGSVTPPPTTGGGSGDSDVDPATPSVKLNVSPGEMVEVGQELTFSGAASSVTGGEIASYQWAIDGETVADGATTTTSFDTAGEYEVSLTVRSAAGISATGNVTVTVAANSEGSSNDSESTDTDESDGSNSTDGEDDGSPGFGFIAALVAGAGWLVRSTRR